MNALLMGYYGARNLGDEMMLVCLRRWLDAQGVSVTVLSEHPRQVERDHGVPAIQNWPLLGEWSWRGAWLKGGAVTVLRAIASHDALIVGGGDLVRDDLGWRGFFFTMEKVAAALVLRKAVYFVNVGLGRPQTRYGRALLRWALPRVEQIIVRDRRSMDVCRDCGAGDRATFVSDIVGLLPGLLASDLGAWDPSLGPISRPYLLVALRESADVFGQYAFDDARVRRFAAGLDAIVDRDDVDVVFVPFQAGEIDDRRLHERVASNMRNRTRTTLRAWTNDIGAVCRLVAGARGVAAMRLHAAVLAVTLARPCAVVPYDHKMREFANLAGLPCIEPTNADRIAFSHSNLSKPDWDALRLSKATPRDDARAPRFVDSRLTKETIL